MFQILRNLPRRAHHAIVSVTLAVLTTLLLPTASAAVNTAPTISGTPSTSASIGALYTFQPKAADANGDPLTFNIANKPAWMWFNASTGKLGGTPSEPQAGRTFSGIRISVSDGTATTSLPSFWITVGAASITTDNVGPTITGTPKPTATVGSNYWFKPTASDANGDALRFSVTGKPAWLSFSASNGSLWGTPLTGNIGTSNSITISVSDGKATTSLTPFTITVGGSTTTNRAPTITGTPVTAAQVGRPYAFKPTAADADGDALRFSISGKPAWASFDATNGTLHGTPTSASVATYPNVVISVTDGKATTKLAPFSITVSAASASRSVTLTWSSPTSNTDGSALTDLAGYTVYYGTSSRVYQSSVSLPGAAANSVVIEGLASGTWYFSIKSRNTMGLESDYSGEVSAVL